MADVAGVEMHERRAGRRVEADAAALQPQAGEAQLLERISAVTAPGYDAMAPSASRQVALP